MTIGSINVITALRQSHLCRGRLEQRGLCSLDRGACEGTNEQTRGTGPGGGVHRLRGPSMKGLVKEHTKPAEEQDKEESAMQEAQASPSASGCWAGRACGGSVLGKPVGLRAHIPSRCQNVVFAHENQHAETAGSPLAPERPAPFSCRVGSCKCKATEHSRDAQGGSKAAEGPVGAAWEPDRRQAGVPRSGFTTAAHVCRDCFVLFALSYNSVVKLFGVSYPPVSRKLVKTSISQ